MRLNIANRVPTLSWFIAAFFSISRVTIAGADNSPTDRGAVTPLSQEVYVWQRAWTPPVQEAVAGHCGAFSNVVALASEVSWNHGKPEAVRVPLDFDTLARTGRPIG